MDFLDPYDTYEVCVEISLLHLRAIIRDWEYSDWKILLAVILNTFHNIMINRVTDFAQESDEILLENHHLKDK